MFTIIPLFLFTLRGCCLIRASVNWELEICPFLFFSATAERRQMDIVNIEFGMLVLFSTTNIESFSKVKCRQRYHRFSSNYRKYRRQSIGLKMIRPLINEMVRCTITLNHIGSFCGQRHWHMTKKFMHIRTNRWTHTKRKSTLISPTRVSEKQQNIQIGWCAPATALHTPTTRYLDVIQLGALLNQLGW